MSEQLTDSEATDATESTEPTDATGTVILTRA